MNVERVLINHIVIISAVLLNLKNDFNLEKIDRLQQFFVFYPSKVVMRSCKDDGQMTKLLGIKYF